jgi:putative membrane protein
MLASPDTAFALKAVQRGVAEVRLGELAAHKAGDPEVRELGKQMIDDHTKANDRLYLVAHRKQMTLPDILSASDQATYSRLGRLSGLAFDQAYAAYVTKSHAADIKDFQTEIKHGRDQDFRDFASQMLPVLQQQLERAKIIRAKWARGSTK